MAHDNSLCFIFKQKTLHPSVESLHKSLQDCSRGSFSDDLSNKTSPLLLSSQVVGDAQVNNGAKHVSSVGRGWKSEDMKNKFVIDSDLLIPHRGNLKKSQSLGSGLYREGRVSADNDLEEETDQGLSCDGSQDRNGFGARDGSKDSDVSPHDQYQKAPTLDTFHVSSDIVNNESIFLNGDQPHSEKEPQDHSKTPLSGELAGECRDQTLHTPRWVVKSRSLPDLGACTPTSRRRTRFGPCSRSSENLHVPDMSWKDITVPEVEKHSVGGEVGDDNICKAEKGTFDNYESCDYSGLAKDWIMPVVDKVNTGKNVQEESLLHQWDELPNKDFKIKRIEEWVNDLQHCSPLEEANESLDCKDNMKRDSGSLNGLAAAKMEDKVTPGMEAAKRYISSLGASATTAQLANHGLVVIPFLIAFASLRVLNLSGNAIGLNLYQLALQISFSSLILPSSLPLSR